MTSPCPEPRNDGDMYLLDGYPSMVYRNSGGWYIDGAEGTPDRIGVPFEQARDRLTLLARRDDVGAIVLAACRAVDTYDAGADFPRLQVIAAVRTAKENAREPA